VLQPDFVEVKDESWENRVACQRIGAFENRDPRVRTIHMHSMLYWVDKPSEPCAIVDVFLYFGLHHGKAIRWRAEFNDKILHRRVTEPIRRLRLNDVNQSSALIVQTRGSYLGTT
jgi:hypothetical protein